MLAYKELDGAVPGSRDLITYDEIADLPEIAVETWPTQEDQEAFETAAAALLEPAAAPVLALEDSAAAATAAASATLALETSPEAAEVEGGGGGGGGGSAAVALAASSEAPRPSPSSNSAVDVLLPDGGDSYGGTDASTRGHLVVVPTTVDGIQGRKMPPYGAWESSMASQAEEGGASLGGAGSTGPEVREYLETQEAFSYDDDPAAAEEGSSAVLIDTGRRRSNRVLAMPGKQPNRKTSEMFANTAHAARNDASPGSSRVSGSSGPVFEQGSSTSEKGVFLVDGGTGSKRGDTGWDTSLSVEAFVSVGDGDDAHNLATPFFGLDEVGDCPSL